MDHILETKLFTITKVEDINAYRRFYQAYTLADITEDEGRKIRYDVWHGTGEPHPSDFNVEFFNQQRPAGKAATTWKKYLRLIAHPTRTLYRPLTGWITTHDKAMSKEEFQAVAFESVC